MAEDRKRILFIDDESGQRALMQAVLFRAGYKDVVCMKSGYDFQCALDQGGIDQWDVVITDNNLGGGMSGIDIADLIAAISPGKPVFIYSSDLTEAEMTRFGDKVLLGKAKMLPLAERIAEIQGTMARVFAAPGKPQVKPGAKTFGDADPA